MKAIHPQSRTDCSIRHFLIGLKDWLKEKTQEQLSKSIVSAPKRSYSSAFLALLVAPFFLLFIGALLARPIVASMTWLGSKALVEIFQIASVIALIAIVTYLPYKLAKGIIRFCSQMCARGKAIEAARTNQSVPIRTS